MIRHIKHPNIGSQNTTIRGADNMIVVQLYETEVVRFNEKKVILNSGGHKTALTCRRMNQASKEFGLGLKIWPQGKVWKVGTRENEIIDFVDNMEIAR